MNTQANGTGDYKRKRTPNGTGSRYQETLGPGNTAGLYAWLAAEVKAGRMTASDKQRRIWAGK